jgi:hypothetical protein
MWQRMPCASTSLLLLLLLLLSPPLLLLPLLLYTVQRDSCLLHSGLLVARGHMAPAALRLRRLQREPWDCHCCCCCCHHRTRCCYCM